MFRSNSILSLLVSTATVGFALPTAKPTSAGAAAVTPCTSTSAPIATSTSLPVDDDQPAPYLSIQLPASRSFDSIRAPAYTLALGSLLPVYSTTPPSIEIRPTDTPGYLPAVSSFSVIFSTTIPIELPVATPILPKLPPALFSEFFSTTIPVELVTQSTIASSTVPVPTSTTSCSESKKVSASPTPAASTHQSAPPVSSAASLSTQTPAGEQKPKPTISTRPPRPGHGWGLPHPSGPKPFHPGQDRPSPSTPPKKPGNAPPPPAPAAPKASSTPCTTTLQTRIRPAATASLR